MAGHHAPPEFGGDRVSPGLLRLLDALTARALYLPEDQPHQSQAQVASLRAAVALRPRDHAQGNW